VDDRSRRHFDRSTAFVEEIALAARHSRTMSEYRNDLEAAHRRIALLEEALGIRPRRPPPRGSRQLVGLLIALTGVGFFIAVFGAVTGRCAPSKYRAQEPVSAVSADTSLQPAKLGASWYTQAATLPTMVDVDGDGTKDLVGLFWKSNQDETPLYAAAIDGKTFALKWSAGPYRSQWASTRTHFAVVGRKMVVTDTRDRVITLDLATGAELAFDEIVGGANDACAFNDGTPRVLLRGAMPQVEQRDRVLDVERDAFLPLVGHPTCAARYESCSDVKDARPCQQWGALAGAPKEAVTSSSFYVTHTLQDGKLAVSLGNPTTAPTGHDEPRAVAFVKGSKTIAWKGSLLVDGDEIHYGSAQSELRDGNLVTFYQAKSGPFRLVSRSALTGAQRWAGTIPDSAEGSYAAAFGIDGNRVLVVMNHTVHVYDSETGEHLAALDATTI
jgi:hypothetical protein